MGRNSAMEQFGARIAKEKLVLVLALPIFIICVTAMDRYRRIPQNRLKTPNQCVDLSMSKKCLIVLWGRITQSKNWGFATQCVTQACPKTALFFIFKFFTSSAIEGRVLPSLSQISFSLSFLDPWLNILFCLVFYGNRG